MVRLGAGLFAAQPPTSAKKRQSSSTITETLAIGEETESDGRIKETEGESDKQTQSD
jgi:hypothetical protein